MSCKRLRLRSASSTGWLSGVEALLLYGQKNSGQWQRQVNPFPANSCSMKQLRRIHNFPRSENGFHQLKRLFEKLSDSAFWLDL